MPVKQEIKRILFWRRKEFYCWWRRLTCVFYLRYFSSFLSWNSAGLYDCWIKTTSSRMASK